MKTLPIYRRCLAFLLITGLVACSSPTKLAETGNYDDAIRVAVRKLAGKEKKKYADVEALETAFTKVTEQDMRQIEALKAQDQPHVWPDIYSILQGMNQRQELINPLLPLIDENGYQAEFRFVRVDPLLNEARENMVAFYYGRGQEFLDQARQEDDRGAARTAVTYFDRVRNYIPSYQNVNSFRNEAIDLGTSHVYIEFDNQSGIPLPQGFVDRLLQFPTGGLNTPWTQFHTNSSSTVGYDYTVVVSLSYLDVSPELIRQREYVEEREIIDHYRVEKDRDGNPVLDSLGNQIEIPVKKWVSADVLETYQHKAALVEGMVSIFEIKTGTMIDQQIITTEMVFEHYSGRFNGDKRALQDATLAIMNSNIVPFPPDGDLILQASDRLRPTIYNWIESRGWV